MTKHITRQVATEDNCSQWQPGHILTRISKFMDEVHWYLTQKRHSNVNRSIKCDVSVKLPYANAAYDTLINP
jgi:hypothetical protein